MLNIRCEACSGITFGIELLVLLGPFTNFFVEILSLLRVLELALSSELSYLTERTGEACLYIIHCKLEINHDLIKNFQSTKHKNQMSVSQHTDKPNVDKAFLYFSFK